MFLKIVEKKILASSICVCFKVRATQRNIFYIKECCMLYRSLVKEINSTKPGNSVAEFCSLSMHTL